MAKRILLASFEWGCRVALVILLLLGATNMHATTRTVISLSDNGVGSLRDTIAASLAGDSIVFQNGLTGTIVLTNGELVIGRNLTITGPGATNLFIDGNQTNRAFEVLTNVSVNISGLTITNAVIRGTNAPLQSTIPGGDAAGGGILNSGSLVLQDCVLMGNAAIGGRAGISSGVQKCGRGAGGAIFNSGTLVLSNCVVTTNQAAGGKLVGTGYALGGDAYGGGLANFGICLIQNSILVSNRATGGDAADSSAENYLPGLGWGGGLYSTGICSVIRCSFYSNSATGGNRFYGDGLGGHGSGGAIANTGGALLVTNCTFTVNLAMGGSGGQQGHPAGDGKGGAISVVGTNLAIVSCTISSNAATGGTGIGSGAITGDAVGGGIGRTSYSGPLILQNVLISDNTATPGVATGSGPHYGTATGADINSSVVSQGFNLISRTNNSTGWTNTDLVGSALAPLNPLLGPLQDNGGFGPTMIPQATSVAIDNGYCPGLARDQRGLPRAVDFPDYSNSASGDASDIGACEVQTFPFDPGLRGFDGTNIIHFAGERAGIGGQFSTPFCVNKNGTNYGILLTSTTATNASKFRIKTSSGIKAFKKLP